MSLHNFTYVANLCLDTAYKSKNYCRVYHLRSYIAYRTARLTYMVIYETTHIYIYGYILHCILLWRLILRRVRQYFQRKYGKGYKGCTAQPEITSTEFTAKRTYIQWNTRKWDGKNTRKMMVFLLPNEVVLMCYTCEYIAENKSYNTGSS